MFSTPLCLVMLSTALALLAVSFCPPRAGAAAGERATAMLRDELRAIGPVKFAEAVRPVPPGASGGRCSCMKPGC